MDDFNKLMEISESELAETIFSLSPEMFLAFIGATVDEYADRHAGFDAEAAFLDLGCMVKMVRSARMEV